VNQLQIFKKDMNFMSSILTSWLSKNFTFTKKHNKTVFIILKNIKFCTVRILRPWNLCFTFLNNLCQNIFHPAKYLEKRCRDIFVTSHFSKYRN